MTIPRITTLLMMLTLGGEAMALQLGQISSQSSRGQPLAARITLYGAAPGKSAALTVEVAAEFGASEDAFTKLGVHAKIANDVSGERYITLASSAAIELAQLAFRVRLTDGSLALVRRYALTMSAGPTPRLASSFSRTVPASITPNANYGPVRAGQSLWRILEKMGLARGATGTLMRTIVAANPAAFVGGDPTRLRVGAMLRLPDTTGIAQAARATVVTAAPRAAVNTNPIGGDAALAARLDRLKRRFASIRAQYADQKNSPAPQSEVLNQAVAPGQNQAAVTPVTQRTEKAPATLARTKAVAKTLPLPPSIAVIKPKPAAQSVSNIVIDLAATRGNYATAKTLLLVGGGALGIALVTLAFQMKRRWRGRRADASVRSADRDRVAEIARKSEKRVQLEGEVKRMIAGRRAATEDPAPNAQRPVDLMGSGPVSMEDIETHIALGRYDNAEKMLKRVITAGPHNHLAKLRLAEIYYLNKRHEEFVALSEEIYRRHRGDIGDENWARLMRMGRIIAPNRPPFSGPIAVDVERQAS